MEKNRFAGMDSRVSAIARHIIECNNMPISLDASDISKVSRKMDLVKGLYLECKGEDMGKVGASFIKAIANVSDYQLRKLLLFIEIRGEYKLMMNQIQECVSILPTDVDVIWGLGIDVNPSDNNQEIGLFSIAGYKKNEGVSRNAPGND